MIVGKQVPGAGRVGAPLTNRKVVARYNFRDPVTVPKLVAYLDGLGGTPGAGPQQVKGLIYSDAGALLGVGDEVVVPEGKPPGWVDLPFSTPGGVQVNAGLRDLGIIAGPTGTLSIWGDTPSSRGGQFNADTYVDGPTASFGAATVVTYDLSIYAPVIAVYEPPEHEDDFYYGGLPFAEAQAELGEETPAPNPKYLVSVGWHHTRADPEWGSFAIVNQDSELAGLLGERVKVTVRTASRERSVVAYVHNRGELFDDLSLSRRLFLELGLLSADNVTATVEVLV